MLGVTACSGAADDASSQPPVAELEIASATASPLEDSFGFASDPARRHSQLIELQEQANRSVVECMRAAGFYYEPPAVAAALPAGVHVGDGSREAVAERGLGVTIALIEAVAAHGQAAAPDATAANASYVTSLTQQQATDYDLALIGAAAPAAESDSYRPAGCWGAAYSEIIARLELLGEFNDELDSLNARLAADPRVQIIDEAWSACMVAAGYDYVHERSLADDVYARLDAIEVIELGGVSQFASQEAVDAALVYERQVALASYDCRAPHEGELADLRFDYEQEFLDDNRFRIAELRPDEE